MWKKTVCHEGACRRADRQLDDTCVRRVAYTNSISVAATYSTSDTQHSCASECILHILSTRLGVFTCSAISPRGGATRVQVFIYSEYYIHHSVFFFLNSRVVFAFYYYTLTKDPLTFITFRILLSPQHNTTFDMSLHNSLLISQVNILTRKF